MNKNDFKLRSLIEYWGYGLSQCENEFYYEVEDIYFIVFHMSKILKWQSRKRKNALLGSKI